MKKKNAPTEEQEARMRAAREITDKERSLLEQRLTTDYDNWRCKICNHHAMTQVVCRKARGSICMSHCKTCEHFSPIFWHCLYREPEKPWHSWASAETQKDILYILNQKTKRNCVLGSLDDDCAYLVIDEATGEIGQGRIRFYDSAWHYGYYEG